MTHDVKRESNTKNKSDDLWALRSQNDTYTHTHTHTHTHNRELETSQKQNSPRRMKD